MKKSMSRKVMEILRAPRNAGGLFWLRILLPQCNRIVWVICRSMRKSVEILRYIVTAPVWSRLHASLLDSLFPSRCVCFCMFSQGFGKHALCSVSEKTGSNRSAPQSSPQIFISYGKPSASSFRRFGLLGHAGSFMWDRHSW